MEVIKAKYSTARALLEAYQWQFLHGGLFVPTRSAYELGNPVVVDISLSDPETSVLLRGYVAWRRPAAAATGPLRPGVGIEFLSSERRKRDFLLGLARGDTVGIRHRRHRRLPVDLHVDWRAKADPERSTSRLEDIGERGAFIRTTTFLPIGRPVILEISPPGSESPISIEGRVSWSQHTPGEEGMGIEFRCRDAGGARRLRELVSRIEQGARGIAASSDAVNTG